MRLLKSLAGLLGLLVVLVAAAVFIAPQVIDPNDFRDEIVAKVKEQTGRDLQIHGEIELSLFPWLGLELGALELSNAKGFDAVPFAAIRQAVVKVRILPLLGRQVEVDRIVLDGLRLNLARARDGRTNWDDLAGRPQERQGDAAGPEPEQRAGQEETAAVLPLAGLAVGGVTVSNADIHWRDERSGERLAVRQLNLRVGAIRPGEPLDLALDFSIESQAPAIRADIRLSATPLLSPAMDRIDIDRLLLDIAASGELPNGRPLKLELETGVALNLLSQHLELHGLRLNANGLLLSGDLEASNLANGPAFSGALKLAELDLRAWLAQYGLPLPATADAAAFTRVALAARLAGAAKELAVTKLALVLDDSNFSGGLKLNGWASEMPAVDFDLEVDAIDLDRYLPPPAEKSAVAETGGAAAAGAPGAQPPASRAAVAAKRDPGILLPVALLRQLDLDGLLRIGRLVVNRLQLEQAELKVRAREGRIKIEQRVERFYQGTLQATAKLDLRGREPRLQITKQATGIQAEPLLQDLTGDGRLRGTGRFRASLETRGNSVQAFRQHLGGEIDFRFERGALQGIDLAQMIRETWARIKGRPIPPASDKPETDFSELTGTATIVRGVLSNEDLMAKSPFLRVDGKGWVDLVQERLDYRLTATIVKSMEGQGGRDLKELAGVPVPVRISGPLAAPETRLDRDELAKRLLTGKVGQKLKKKLEGKLPDELLRGLFQ